MATYPMKIEVEAKDSTGPAFKSAQAHVESYAERIRRLNREDRASGQTALEKSLSQGGLVGLGLAGLGMGVAEIAANQLGQTAQKLGETFKEMAKGTMTASQAVGKLADGFVRSMPAIGAVYSGTVTLIDGIDDLAAAYAKSHGSSATAVESMKSYATQIEDANEQLKQSIQLQKMVAEAHGRAKLAGLQGPEKEIVQADIERKSQKEANRTGMEEAIKANPANERIIRQQFRAADQDDEKAYQAKLAEIRKKAEDDEASAQTAHLNKMRDLHQRAASAALQESDPTAFKVGEIRRQSDTEVAGVEKTHADATEKHKSTLDAARGKRENAAKALRRSQQEDEHGPKEALALTVLANQSSGHVKQTYLNQIAAIGNRDPHETDKRQKELDAANKDFADAVKEQENIDRRSAEEKKGIHDASNAEILAAQRKHQQEMAKAIADGAAAAKTAQQQAGVAALRATGATADADRAQAKAQRDEQIEAAKREADEAIKALPHDESRDKRTNQIIDQRDAKIAQAGSDFTGENKNIDEAQDSHRADLQSRLVQEHITDLRAQAEAGNRAAGLAARQLEIEQEFTRRRREDLEIAKDLNATEEERAAAKADLGTLGEKQAQAEATERRKAMGEWQASMRETALATNVNAGYLTGIAQTFQAHADMAAHAMGFQKNFTATADGGGVTAGGTGNAAGFISRNMPAVGVGGAENAVDRHGGRQTPTGSGGAVDIAVDRHDELHKPYAEMLADRKNATASARAQLVDHNRAAMHMSQINRGPLAQQPMASGQPHKGAQASGQPKPPAATDSTPIWAAKLVALMEQFVKTEIVVKAKMG